jgi:hypothetical protein
LRKIILLSGAVLAACIVAWTAPLALIIYDVHHTQPGLPDGWRLKVSQGTPDFSIQNDAHGKIIRLRSVKSSFGLERKVDIDATQFPFLQWTWKVNELPRGGDFRRATTDDQAAQVLVAFNDRRVLTYLWDSSAPRNTIQSASNIPFMHIFAVVCRSGPSELNQWLSESRNVVEDYQRAFGHPPQRVEGIRLQINSQHTGSSAESYFGDVAFRSSPQ